MLTKNLDHYNLLLKNVTTIEKVNHFCYKGAHFKNEARHCNYPLTGKTPIKMKHSVNYVQVSSKQEAEDLTGYINLHLHQ